MTKTPLWSDEYLLSLIAAMEDICFWSWSKNGNVIIDKYILLRKFCPSIGVFNLPIVKVNHIKDAVFYLQSRGINKDKAVSILINAFFDEIIQKINQNIIKDKVHKILSSKIESYLNEH